MTEWEERKKINKRERGKCRLGAFIGSANTGVENSDTFICGGKIVEVEKVSHTRVVRGSSN